MAEDNGNGRSGPSWKIIGSYAVAALAFLIMVVGSYIFNRVEAHDGRLNAVEDRTTKVEVCQKYTTEKLDRLDLKLETWFNMRDPHRWAEAKKNLPPEPERK